MPLSVLRTAAMLRLALGWIFLWAFLDKVFGWGFATAPEQAWLAGGSPTTGFLKFGVTGPFAEVFQALAGSALVDWLFMIGLLLLGVSLLLGVGLRIASWGGIVLMALLWLASLWPEHNPIVDEHVVYGLVLFLLPRLNAGEWLGLGKWWGSLEWVKRHGWVK